MRRRDVPRTKRRLGPGAGGTLPKRASIPLCSRRKHMTASSYLRVALVLPPVQSFFMPYSAPAMLAAVLKEKFDAQTLVIDAGIDWLWSEVEQGHASIGDDLAALQQTVVYRDVFALREAFYKIDRALSQIC